MKNRLILIILAVLCLGLAGCSGNGTGDTNRNDENLPSATHTGPGIWTVPTEPIDQSTPMEPADPEEAADARSAYAQALENLRKNHVFPDGTACEPSTDMEANEFTILDVNRDGQEELIISFTNTYSAGMTGMVVAYDRKTKELRIELREFPLLTFYDNGVIMAGLSHNQGLAGENFWPYSLYQYGPDTKNYVLVGMADAWDKKYAATDLEGRPFPEEIDKSGAGMVYYVMLDGQSGNSQPVDAAQYHEWIQSFIGGVSKISIEYRKLTEENIRQVRGR